MGTGDSHFKTTTPRFVPRRNIALGVNRAVGAGFGDR